ncbi:MAG: patatin-like phospholipase family protein, partial [Elusimicrobia bacterium]|nr:patatin-like phospholipase family protein [Elusimicrobiota bacterium]
QPTLVLELARADFDVVLLQHPRLALALSRYLAKRLMETNQHPPAARILGKTHVVMGALPGADRAKFVFQLASSALRQTRFRVLLVEVVEESEQPLVARLTRSARGIPPHMDLQDFQTIEGLRSLVYTHPGGPEILCVSQTLLSGPLFGGLYPLVSTARQEWNHIFISFPGRPSRAARALWDEADRVLYVRHEAAEKGGPLWRDMEAAVAPPRLDLVELLGSSPQKRNRPGRFYIAWQRGAGSDSAGLGLSTDEGPIRQSMDRMARHLVGMRIGLAMGAGAALGYSVIGVLRALERHGIYPDLLAGTSMGALIGSFYAAGKSVDELEEIALSITKRRLWSMADLALPWKGVLTGNGVLRFLKSNLGDTGFDQLKLPFACVATDIHSGAERVLRHGNVAEAVRASISLPFFFEPFFWQGRYLVDGGVVNPVPSSVVEAMGADVTLSINITTAPGERRSMGRRTRKPSVFNPLHGPNIFRVMAKTLYTMQYGIATVGAHQADVVIAPPLSDFFWSEFHRAADIIKIGEEETERLMPKIKSKIARCGEASLLT